MSKPIQSPTGFNMYANVLGGKRDYNNNIAADLFAFEYYDEGWKTPYRFREDEMSDNWYADDGYSNYKECLISTNELPMHPPLYRIIYEYCDNGQYIKLNVPEEWYFRLLRMCR